MFEQMKMLITLIWPSHNYTCTELLYFRAAFCVHTICLRNKQLSSPIPQIDLGLHTSVCSSQSPFKYLLFVTNVLIYIHKLWCSHWKSTHVHTTLLLKLPSPWYPQDYAVFCVLCLYHKFPQEHTICCVHTIIQNHTYTQPFTFTPQSF